MTVAVLVPRRSDGGRRDELWAFCRAWWEREFPDFEIVEGTHEGGRFNRSAAVNQAAASTDADILIVADGDVIVPPGQVRAGVKVAMESGRAVLPYEDGGYTPLTQSVTDQVLAGYEGKWDRTPSSVVAYEKSPNHVSSCVIVTRPLFDRVGGFDERFDGWGPEDRVFHLQVRVLGGGVERITRRDVGAARAQVFHLWHPLSTERAAGGNRNGYRSDPVWLAGKALWDHAAACVQPKDMERFIEDRNHTDGVLLVFVTNGRRDCLTTSIPSALERLHGNIRRVAVVDDSGDEDYRAWIRWTFPDVELHCTKGGTGFDGAYRTVWSLVGWYGLPWAYIVEDDFTHERDVDLAAMQQVMGENPHLCQMALRRQPWFRAEIEAGGVVEQNPDAYTDQPTHMEHRLFVTTNPALWSRTFVARHPWPKGANSEARFATDVFRDPDARSGYWGARADDPWVIHDGERSGSRY